MTVSALASSTASTTSTTASSSSLGLDTTEFLQLMVKQLQNQNPTDPTDTTEFLSQLVQLSTYDQQVSNSNSLSSVVSALDTMISSNGLGYIGKNVTVEGDTTTLLDGSARWNYTLDGDAKTVTFKILDEDGKTVYSGDGETKEGTYAVDWDGVSSAGVQLDDGGIYTLEVTATDDKDAKVSVSTSVTGTVTGIDSSTDETYLLIGDVGFTVDDITSISSS
ncbi:flagellar hook assembly protein FlgD [Cohaesibacter haloalkalitolerans]|uniref:flagellar hook assembly protein FlgD n=1 Tax=Cohaesibacter haloalkalitolerans TaxID=1162980 RepID=UPI0013C43F7E|nr:flagellar hook capping FlgD N-terminal domain-containing protein [Cohaesibacter haloalkalitolerans]